MICGVDISDIHCASFVELPAFSFFFLSSFHSMAVFSSQLHSLNSPPLSDNNNIDSMFTRQIETTSWLSHSHPCSPLSSRRRHSWGNPSTTPSLPSFLPHEIRVQMDFRMQAFHMRVIKRGSVHLKPTSQQQTQSPCAAAEWESPVFPGLILLGHPVGKSRGFVLHMSQVSLSQLARFSTRG